MRLLHTWNLPLLISIPAEANTDDVIDPTNALSQGHLERSSLLDFGVQPRSLLSRTRRSTSKGSDARRSDRRSESGQWSLSRPPCPATLGYPVRCRRAWISQGPLGRPSRFPLVFTTASPPFVLSEIRSGSTSANNPNRATITLVRTSCLPLNSVLSLIAMKRIWLCTGVSTIRITCPRIRPSRDSSLTTRRSPARRIAKSSLARQVGGF